ncbi:hypothetical protein [Desulfomicrobium salsuginis]
MARRFSILLIAFLVAAAWLPGPVDALASALDAPLRQAQDDGRLSAGDAQAIEAAIDQARADGLPPAPFIAKAEEGLAKRVAGRAIIQALETMRSDYAFARDALAREGREPSPDDVVMAGDSLRVGLTRQELDEMAALAPPASPAELATAARTRAALNAVAFPARLSDAILRRGLAAGSLSAQWTQLFRVVQRTREAGMADAAVADAAMRTLDDGGGPAELLQELGLTGRDIRRSPGKTAK